MEKFKLYAIDAKNSRQYFHVLLVHVICAMIALTTSILEEFSVNIILSLLARQ